MFLVRLLERQDVRTLWKRVRSEWGVTLLVAFTWFVCAYAAIYWAEGYRPIVFFTPDEAANRFAASVINKTGHPYLQLPFDDVEDTAHPHAWLSQGNYAIPIYPPVSIYFYALLTHLRRFGSITLIVLPALALAAFAAGVAALLPRERRWLALFAPALGMPALYWLLRPWMNICALLTCVCFAFFCWAHFRASAHERTRTYWLGAALCFVGLGAAVRPDYTAYALLFVFALTASKEPAGWRRILVFTALAGAIALGSNLFFNRLVTGHAFRAAYQMAMDADPGAPRTNLVARLLGLLFFPMKFPGWRVVGAMLVKYWVQMQPIWLLVLGQLALIPLVKGRPRLERAGLLFVLALVFLFMISRVDPELFGADRDVSLVRHSIPRYWSPVYLLAGVAPVLFVARTERRTLLVGGAILLGALAAANVFEIGWHDKESVLERKKLAARDLRRLNAVSARVPADAIVYTPWYDKLLWSRFRVGSMDDLPTAAQSMRRAVDSGLPVYVWLQPGFKPGNKTFARALAHYQLMLVTIDDELRVYRVAPFE